jgi:hypothetical protein
MKDEQAAWPHAFFTSGEQGAEPPGERAAPQGPRFGLGQGARSRPLAQVQTIVGYGIVFLAGLSYGFLPYLRPAYPKRTWLVEVSSRKEYGERS